MITIKLVSEESELEGISQLQKLNHYQYIDKPEALSQGYVSAEYPINFLKEMHHAHPSVIAKHGKAVIGYALVSPKSIRHSHALLGELFDVVDTVNFKGTLLKDSNYVAVGQLCVAKEFRGKGISKLLYNHFKENLSNKFDYCITDVATNNAPSLKAHLSTGFEIVDSQVYGGIHWHIVLWDWNK